VARRVVRLSAEAARQAAQAAQAQQVGSPVHAAKDAVLIAAEIHAPGLLGAAVETARDASRHFTQAAQRSTRAIGQAANTTVRSAGRAVDASLRDAQRNFAQAGVPGGQSASGRWVRRGNTIILFGV
jgi:hypothetical protein